MRICPSCSLKTEAKTCPQDGSQTVEVGQYEAVQNDPFVGQVFEGRYRIDGILGTGGFGAVYRGEQLAMGRPVAIKLLHSQFAEDVKEVARFQREARAIAALRHPNIVQVYDFGQTKDGYLYLVMECLDGRTLKHIVRAEAPIAPDRIIEYLVQALDGLAEAHANGVVHRDLKPENVFCASIGRREDVIKLLDFGIAKLLDESGASMTLTGKGMAVGSPRYMSPEQARAKPITPQTDLYLIGLIFYELLTGRPVFQRKSPTDYLLAHIRDTPDPPAVDGVELSGPLVDLVLQCLAKTPEDRPESAEALMGALEACRGRGLHELGAVTGAFAVKAEAHSPVSSQPHLEATPAAPERPAPTTEPLPPPVRPETLQLPRPDGLSSLPPASIAVPKLVRPARPPAPSTYERLPVPPLPAGSSHGVSVGAPPSPVVVAAAVVVAMLLVLLGLTVYWSMGDRLAPSTDPGAAVIHGTEQPDETPGGEARPVAEAPDATADADGAEDAASDEVTAAKSCKSSRDCDPDETCIDGVCEAD